MYSTLVTTRDRLEAYGPTPLTDCEILATLFGQDMPDDQAHTLAQALLTRFESWLGLQRASLVDLCTVVGMLPARAAALKVALDLGRRQLLPAPGTYLQISKPADLATLLMLEMSHLEQEHVRVVVLNTKNYVLGIETVVTGSLNKAGLRVAEIFKPAIRANAAAIVVVHNHPSGEPTPSLEDRAFTEELLQAGRLMDIPCLDHLIIGAPPRWVSLRERDLGLAWG